MGQIADRMSLSTAETEKLGNITTHPPSRHKLRSLRQQRVNRSLMNWLIQPVEIISHHQCTAIRGWRRIEEGQTLLRKLGWGKALFRGQFTEPERTAFTRDLSKNWISQGPGLWHAALADLLSPLVEQDFTKWKRLAVLSNSDQHVQHVCKVAEQPRGK